MRGMVVYVEWYVWNDICGMGWAEWQEWNPEGWECLVYRLVHTLHPWVIRILKKWIFTRSRNYVYCLFSSTRFGNCMFMAALDAGCARVGCART